MFIAKDPSAGDDVISMGLTGINANSNTIPAQAYDDPLADVFGSESESSLSDGEPDDTAYGEQARSAPEGRSDIARLRSTHVTNGYRDGIGIGKDETIQAGFDEGYALGAEFGILIGRIIGVLEGLVDVAAESTDSQITPRHEQIKDLLLLARERLTVEKLFGPPYFDEAGIWTFPITDSDKTSTEISESEITFRRVAASHPIIIEMSKLAYNAAKECGLAIGSSTQSADSHKEAR